MGRKLASQWFDRLRDQGTLAAGAGMLFLNQCALRAGLCRRPDGWRNAAGCVLRGEQACFVLSAFGLNTRAAHERGTASTDASQEQTITRRLASFLEREPSMHRRIVPGEHRDRAEPCGAGSYTLRFEDWTDGPERFVRPEQWGEPPGAREPLPLLNFVCRRGVGDRIDLWVRANHVGTDGVPVQEMMSRLEREWGLVEETTFPSPEEFGPHSRVRECPGRRGIGEVQTLVDFSRLLDWRKRANAVLAEPMTVSAALMWCLSQHPEFADLHMGTTLDMPATSGQDRGVGVVTLCPAEYHRRERGLERYVHDFNRRLEQARGRAGTRGYVLDAAALMPERWTRRLLQHALENQPRAFGTLGLTMLKDAIVFGAPIGDAGHENGFIAVGSMALPTGDGRRVGCVTIKGPKEKIARYPRHIRDAVDRCAQLDA